MAIDFEQLNSKYDFSMLENAKKEQDILDFLAQFSINNFSHGMITIPANDFLFVADWIDTLAHRGHNGHTEFAGWQAIFKVEDGENPGRSVHYRFYHTHTVFSNKGPYSDDKFLVLHFQKGWFSAPNYWHLR